MTSSGPRAVRVVIPTRNRIDSIRRALDALCRQSYPLERVEVVVVVDGSSDGTAAMVSGYEAPFALQMIEQPAQGPAVARNRGAAGCPPQGGRTAERLLIFLDDDIEATPELIAAHVRAHQVRPGGVVIGYLPPILKEQRGFFRVVLRQWWEGMFAPMRLPEHRFAYSNLTSGNFSLDAELFARVCGFDTALRCHEDYELGLRLLQAGASFSFAPDALGYHHERTDLDRCLARKEQEGKADVQLGRRHPELRPALLMARLLESETRRARLLRRLAFTAPRLGDLGAAHLRRSLALLEWARARSRWSSRLDHLLAYWYWRGVAQELGAEQELIRFIAQEASRASEGKVVLDLDLAEGIERAERRLDEARPDGVRLWYGPHSVGTIPPQPGAERLRGAHLRPVLVDSLAWPLLTAMAVERAAGLDLGPGAGMSVTEEITLDDVGTSARSSVSVGI